MEFMHGKQSFQLDGATLRARLAGYRELLIDLGTGDGRYVHHLAQSDPTRFVVGLDACRENLVDFSRRARPNSLYLIANTEALPPELGGLAQVVTINFPWGSLLTGLLDPGSGLIDGLLQMARPGAKLEIRLNSGALQEAGWGLEEGGQQVRRVFKKRGFSTGQLVKLDAVALKAFPTSWARRLAYGRDPQALYLNAILDRTTRLVERSVEAILNRA